MPRAPLHPLTRSLTRQIGCFLCVIDYTFSFTFTGKEPVTGRDVMHIYSLECFCREDSSASLFVYLLDYLCAMSTVMGSSGYNSMLFVLTLLLQLPQL